MKTTLTFLALVLLFGATTTAEVIPTGPASSYNTTTKKTTIAMGVGGVPALNYQKSDGTWDFIVDDWVQVGDRQVWKSIRGNHRIFADSTGAAIYAKGDHYLGTKTVRLIKFKLSDSTWQEMKASLPDSVRTSGRTITFHGIFPGVDKQLVNNAKALKRYTETFIFHQEARDTIAAYGPWAGYLLGTATRLNVDSLNLSLKDAAGLFDITDAGRMTDGWIKGMNIDTDTTMVWAIAKSYLSTVDSTTSITVKKRIVMLGGIPYLVELFDPIPTASFPAGDIWHNATFGYSTAGGSSEIIEDVVFGTVASPASNGTMDSITGYYFSNGVAKSMRMGVFIENTSLANQDLIDSTAEFTVGFGDASWHSKETRVGVPITISDQYSICVWASSEIGNGYGYSDFTSSAYDTMWHNSGVTYEAAWPDPITASNIEPQNAFSIYGYYTEATYFGDYTEGDLFINTNDAYYGGLFTLPDSANVGSLAVYMQVTFGAPDHNCALLIYDKDSTFMGKTEERAISASVLPSWQYFDISGTVELSAGQYTLGLSSDEQTDQCLLYYYNSPDTDSMCFKSIVADYYNYASPADPLLYTYLASYQASIVCFYDVVEAPPGVAPKGRRRRIILGGL